MKFKKFRQKLFLVLAIAISIFLLFFFITGVWIGYEVDNLCQNARWQYGGSCSDALIAQLNDEKQGFRARNHAIWALGQLSDSSSLPYLEKFYTGQLPNKEPLDETISQYELKKAINLVNGGTNLTAYIWRGFFQTR